MIPPQEKFYAPVALFVYNRPRHTAETVRSLLDNAEAASTDLYIFSDGPKDSDKIQQVFAVREYLASISGFRSIKIVERATNLGLARSIISGISDLLKNHTSLIVMEDDLKVSRYFLRFMNTSLEKYADQPRVASIHGWNFPLEGEVPDTFFLRGADCWGWATWRRAWAYFEPDGNILLSSLNQKRLNRTFDLDGAYPYTQMLRDQISGRNNSWAIRWHASAFINDMLTLHPGRSLVQNIGLDNTGTHSVKDDSLETQIYEISDRKYPAIIEEDRTMRKRIIKYICKGKPSVKARAKESVRGWLRRIFR